MPESINVSVDAAPTTITVHHPASWTAPTITVGAIALVCGALAAILSHALRRSASDFPKWARIALSVTLPTLPIVILPAVALAGLENVPWSSKANMLLRPTVIAILIGVLVCAPIAAFVAREKKQQNFPEIFD